MKLWLKNEKKIKIICKIILPVEVGIGWGTWDTFLVLAESKLNKSKGQNILE